MVRACVTELTHSMACVCAYIPWPDVAASHLGGLVDHTARAGQLIAGDFAAAPTVHAGPVEQGVAPVAHHGLMMAAGAGAPVSRVRAACV